MKLKQLYLIGLILCIIPLYSNVNGQNTDKSNNLLTDQQISNRIFEKTDEVIRTKDANSSLLANFLHPAALSKSFTLDVTTETDSITFTSATMWVSVGVLALDDTIQIALQRDFSDAKRIFPFSAQSFVKFSPITFPKIYIKRKGTTGTANYDISWEGY